MEIRYRGRGGRGGREGKKVENKIRCEIRILHVKGRRAMSINARIFAIGQYRRR